MPVPVVLLAVLLGAPAASAPAPPTFATVVSCGEAAKRCLSGKHVEGQEVLLISADVTCALKTGKPAAWRPPDASAADPAAPATALVGACPGDFVLAAVGASPSSFARVQRRPVTSPVQMESLLLRISREGALDRAFEEARAGGEATGKEQLAEESPSEAFTLDGVAPSPAFLRFPLRGENGPVLVVEADRVATPFHLCSGPLVPFRLGGRVYASAWSGPCAGGARGEVVLEIAEGKVREVFAGFELAE